jgi:hypothetical protein
MKNATRTKTVRQLHDAIADLARAERHAERERKHEERRAERRHVRALKREACHVA